MEKPRRSIFGSPAKKHVIFLGAGASKTSGYPLANELTLLMCDPLSFRKGLRSALQRDGDDGHGFEVNSVITQYQSSEAAKLLRAGDFATMDELSKTRSRTRALKNDSRSQKVDEAHLGF